MPPFATQVGVYNEWIKKIDEATNGRIKITLYPGSALLKEDDAVAGVKRGIADIADVHPQRYPGGRPLCQILSLPFVPIGDAESEYKIWMDLENKFPEMKAEYNKDFKILMRTNTGSYALHTIKKEVHLPADLKGMKIMASTELADVMKDIGAAPMSLVVTDWYLSLDRGLIDAMWMNWPGLYDMKCTDFLKYHTFFPSGISMGMLEVIMNLDTWNKLPPDVQKVFDDLSPWVTERVRQLEEIDKTNQVIDALKKEGGHTFVTLTPAEEKAWRDAADPVIKKYLADVEGKGLPGNAVYNEMLRLAAQYRK
jgi:TRAP-type C4-dicarboxylate transport system substrate-binding protein